MFIKITVRVYYYYTAQICGLEGTEQESEDGKIYRKKKKVRGSNLREQKKKRERQRDRHREIVR